MRSLLRALLLSALPLASCGPSPHGPPRAPPDRAAARPACPLGVPGTTVRAMATPDGAALELVTGEGRVDELRERARHAAKLHGPFGRLGKGHDGQHGTGGHHGLQAIELPRARAVAEDIPGGARITIVPEQPSDADTLRELLARRAQRMRDAPCDR